MQDAANIVFNSLPHLRFAQAAAFSTVSDGYCHCKTVPFYIFAQAFEGHYEIDAGGEFAVCEEGGAFFVPPNIPLKIWHYVNPASGIMRIRFVHFIPEDQRGTDPFARFKPRLAVSCAECVEPGEIIQRLINGSERDDFQTASDFLHLLSLFRTFMRPEEKAHSPECMEQLLQWIREHASQPIHSADLEKAFPFSRSKMFSLFRAVTGMSPGDWILRERIRYAVRLMLCEPDISVKEIADRCGWKTPFHFSRIFHRIMGEAPGRYVKHAQYDSGISGDIERNGGK